MRTVAGRAFKARPGRRQTSERRETSERRKRREGEVGRSPTRMCRRSPPPCSLPSLSLQPHHTQQRSTTVRMPATGQLCGCVGPTGAPAGGDGAPYAGRGPQTKNFSSPAPEQVPAPCPPYSPSFHVFYCTENTCHFVSLSPSISEPTVLPAPLPLVVMGVARGGVPLVSSDRLPLPPPASRGGWSRRPVAFARGRRSPSPRFGE